MLIRAGCQHLLTIFEALQITSPEPVARELQMRTNPFRLFISQIDIVIAGSGTALATLCT